MQKKVENFNNRLYCHKGSMPLYARLMDIDSELGELAKEYLKSSDYGESEFKVTDDFKMEFGDVLYALLSLANENNIDANQSIDMALKKYEDRINKKKNMGSGK